MRKLIMVERMEETEYKRASFFDAETKQLLGSECVVSQFVREGEVVEVRPPTNAEFDELVERAITWTCPHCKQHGGCVCA